MTLPKGWKNEQKSASTNEQKSASTNEQKSSMISVDDKIVIQELITKYNLAIDNKNIDEWTNTWTDDGIWTTTFGEAKGKTELKNMVNQITNEFASGKIYVLTNNMTNVKSYLVVIIARNIRVI